MTICLVIVLCLGLMAGTFFMARNMVKRGVKPGKAVLMQMLAFACVYACTLGSSFVVTSADNNIKDNESVSTAAVVKTAADAGSESVNTIELQKEANKRWNTIAMALSIGLACIGCGIAIASAAPAAIGAVSEDPKSFGKAIIFVGLAESVSLFGLLIAILIKFL